MPDRAEVSTAARLLQSAVDDRIFPAAVVEVGSRAGSLWRQPFGTLTFDDEAPPAGVDTIFDLASLTKPIATTSVVLDLIERGVLQLDDHLAIFFPEWTGADRALATIEHLLGHASGLSARLLDRPPDDRRTFEHEICAMPLEYRPGTRSIYSDLGFILLGFCAEQRGGRPLALQAQAVLDRMATTGGGPASELFAAVPPTLVARTAPTIPLPEDARRGRILIGEVHDDYAAILGGFAGHAGLFGTAAGVGRFARTLLRALLGDGLTPRPFTRDTMERATRRTGVPGSSRALGWDTMLPTSSCGARLSPAAFGHVGFTGTSLWIDPARDRYFVLLTNRACGGGSSEQMQTIRRAFHDALAGL